MGNYKSPINPRRRGKRRAKFHDYTLPYYYMITIAKNPGIPVFSRLSISQTPISFIQPSQIDPARVNCNYTPLGLILHNEIAKFNQLHPEAQIENRIIMPDHIHFIFHVKKRLKEKSEFSRLIAQFKGAYSRAYSETLPQFTPVFEKGFNDLICFRRGQLAKFKNYIQDNPRRLTIKLLNPNLFTSALRVQIGEKEYKVIGNIFLLQHPVLEQVRFSSKFSQQHWEDRKKYLRKVIDREGVLISPFIHPEESQFLREAIAGEAGIIYIRNRDYGEKDKPEGQLFYLCAEGRLLIIAYGEEGQRKDSISKAIAMEMNALAEEIANHQGEFLLKRAK